MTDEELSLEECMDQLSTLAEELPRDRDRMNRLLREGAFQRKGADGFMVATPQVAGELVQTVFSAQHDTVLVVNSLFQHQQDVIESIEQSVYQDVPRAVRALMEALRGQNGLTDEAVARVNSILDSEDDSQESFLNKEDGEYLLSALVGCRTLLESLTNSEDPAVVQIVAAIEKVKQLTPALQDNESAEAEGSPPEEATASS